jgi:hypothetical protein
LSYDLKFFRVPDGSAPQAAYQQLIEAEETEIVNSSGDRPVSDSERQQMENVATALKAWRPEFEQFESERPLTWIELDDEQLALQLVITANAVDATVAYFDERVSEIMDTLIGCSKVLADVAGYIAYDPQLDRPVTAADRNDLIAQYKRIDHSMLRSIPGALQSADRDKPWWKFW